MHIPSFNSTAEEAKLQTISKTQENLIIRRGIKYEIDSNTVVGLYLHNTLDSFLGLSGCLLKIKSEAPLLDNYDKVKQLANSLSMQVLAAKPLFLNRSDIPSDFIDKEKTAIEEQFDDKTKAKPRNVIETILKGKVDKSLDSVTLYEQVFMISEDAEEKQVKKIIQDLSQEISNKLYIEEFTTFACEKLDK